MQATPALAALLRRTGFDQQQVGARLGVGMRTFGLSELDIPGWLRRTAGGTALEALIRLLLVGTSEEAEAVKHALGEEDFRALLESGIVLAEGDRVSAVLR